MTQEEKSKIYHDRYQAFIDQRLEYFDDTVKQLLKYWKYSFEKRNK